ncbi:MAG: lytic murein transglycosylase [Alphaproteobacteria bacterium]|nr:lytic murein transglycosylase [Alphaproteobacteria bacterium]
MKNFTKILRKAFFCACLVLPPLAGGAGSQRAPETKAPVTTTVTTSKKFLLWLHQLKKEAAAKGISKAVINDALPDSMQPLAAVLERDRKQPERTKTLEEYLAAVLSDTRVNNGQQNMETYKPLLKNVSVAYPVDPEVIVALWGLETSYGKNTGGFNVVNALATLAYEGSRREFFRGELFKALKILEQERMPASSLKGSWAGAMGQCQFMPSSFSRFAVDFDKDGCRDIWGTPADVFASAANYLSTCGWKKGELWGRRVALPAHFNRSLLGLDKRYPLKFWNSKGIKLPGGGSIPLTDTKTTVSLIQPDGAGTPVYAVYNNYRVILKWNNSTHFATSIGTLSDKLKGPADFK